MQEKNNLILMSDTNLSPQNNSEILLENKSLKTKLKLAARSLSYDKEKQIKLALILVMVILIALDSNMGLLSHAPINDSCFVDNLITITRPMHKLYKNNKGFRDTICILGSMSIDISCLYLCIRWIFFEDTWRLGVATIAFYGVRAFVQMLYIMKYDEEYFWEAPPIKSILVTYIHTNDYFFSGHVGFPVLTGIEFLTINQVYFAIPCFLVAVLEAFLVIMARTHYSIDVFAGVFAAHYIFIICDYWEKFIREKCAKNKQTEEIGDIKLKEVSQEELLPSGINSEMYCENSKSNE